MKADFVKKAREKLSDRPSRSVRNWLIRAFILFTLLMLIALWFLETVFLEPIYKSIKTSQIKETAASLS